MKTFRDSSGNDWTVFEVRRQVSSTKSDWSYLPNGFSNGWLCFENQYSKRRLVRYPERWREFGDVELEKLLVQALPAPRTAFRLGDDFTDPSTSPDARTE
jgi:hypothetical protein